MFGVLGFWGLGFRGLGFWVEGFRIVCCGGSGAIQGAGVQSCRTFH